MRVDTLERIWPPQDLADVTAIPDEAWSAAARALLGREGALRPDEDAAPPPWSGGWRLNAPRSTRLQAEGAERRVEFGAPQKPIDFNLRGLIRSARAKVAPGTIIVSGTVVPATGDSRIITRIRGADLVALEPYLLRAGETGVERGTLDMDLEAVVRARRLHAPGTLTLNHLVLASAPHGLLGTFMGMPRAAAIASLKNAKGQVTVHFTLDGNLDDPHFSVNESLGTRVGVAMARVLGVTIGGLAKEVGTFGEEGVKAVGAAAQGVGGAVQRLFGK